MKEAGDLRRESESFALENDAIDRESFKRPYLALVTPVATSEWRARLATSLRNEAAGSLIAAIEAAGAAGLSSPATRSWVHALRRHAILPAAGRGVRESASRSRSYENVSAA